MRQFKNVRGGTEVKTEDYHDGGGKKEEKKSKQLSSYKGHVLSFSLSVSVSLSLLTVGGIKRQHQQESYLKPSLLWSPLTFLSHKHFMPHFSLILCPYGLQESRSRGVDLQRNKFNNAQTLVSHSQSQTQIPQR